MIRRIVGAVLFVLLFNAVALGVLLRLPYLLGLAWTLALGTVFLWWHLRRSQATAKRRALIRIRRPKSAPFWVAVACLSSLLLAFGVSGLIELSTRPLGPDELKGWEQVLAYQRSPGGWIASAALLALVIPLVEEFCFRGYIQHSLERRYGPVPAIGITSVLFMSTHVGVPHWSILLIPLLVGLANGAAVYVFGSIWVAVAIHAAWNAAMVILGTIHADPTSTFGEPSAGWLLASSLVLLGSGAAGWYAILRAGRGRLRGAVRIGGGGGPTRRHADA